VGGKAPIDVTWKTIGVVKAYTALGLKTWNMSFAISIAKVKSGVSS
jgi:hypothetical protein